MRQHRYQQQRIDAGLCGNCGTRRPKPGCTDCLTCLRRKALTQIDLRAERRERGLCPECGRKRLAGRWGCLRCVTKHREAARKYRARKRQREEALDAR